VCVSINCTNISVNQMSLHTWLGFVLRVIALSCAGVLAPVLQEEAISVINYKMLQNERCELYLSAKD